MARFTSGDIVVYRVGTGSAALSGSSTAVFLDEYSSTGTLVQSIALPTASAGANQPLTASGSATSEGALTLSGNGSYLLLTGYAAGAGVASISGTTATADPRVVGRVGADGSIDTQTVLTGFGSGNNVRGAVSADGSALYAFAATGDAYTTIDSTAAPATLSTANTRQAEIFGNQLYYATGSGTAGIYSLGTGLPTSGAQTPTLVVADANPYAFFFADLNPGVGAAGGYDTLYVADNTTANDLEKFTYSGTAWVASGKVTTATPLAGGAAVSFGGLTGLTASVSGTNVNLFLTNGSSILKFTDTTGYNGTLTGAATTIAAATTNAAFRGVAFAPAAVAATPTIYISSPAISQNEGNSGSTAYTYTLTRDSGTANATVSYAVTGTGANPADANDFTGGALPSGTATFTGSALTTTVTINVSGDTMVEPDEQFTLTLSNPSAGYVLGTTTAQTGTIVNDDMATDTTPRPCRWHRPRTARAASRRTPASC